MLSASPDMLFRNLVLYDISRAKSKNNTKRNERIILGVIETESEYHELKHKQRMKIYM